MYWKDCRGTPITEGALVAYNFSGDVAPGEVVAVTRTHVKVRLDRTTHYSKAATPGGHISKVKRPRSLLVLVQAP